MKRKLLIFALIAICGIASIFVGRLLFRQEKRTDIFVVGTAAGYAPFVSINANGIYEGFDIDFARALASTMQVPLELKDFGSMTSLFLALSMKKIDAIIWGLSVTQDRLKRVAMVPYYGERTISYPLIFWKQIPSFVQSIEDMSGMTICVEPGSSQDAVLSKYKSILKKPTEKVDDALLNLQYGKADAAFVEPAIAKKFQKKFPEIVLLDIPLNKEDQVLGIGVAIAPDNIELIKKISLAVDALRTSGKIEALAQKWGIE